MKLQDIAPIIAAMNPRSAWNKGVQAYALELLEKAHDWGEGEREMGHTAIDDSAFFRNGAIDWLAYSEGGNALVYDADIAARLCNHTELRRTHNGELDPNERENWIQCQARALSQAATLIFNVAAGNR